MRYHLFQKFFWEMVKIKETSFLSTRGMYLSCHGCTYVCSAFSIIIEANDRRAFLFVTFLSSKNRLLSHQKNYILFSCTFIDTSVTMKIQGFAIWFIPINFIGKFLFLGIIHWFPGLANTICLRRTQHGNFLLFQEHINCKERKPMFIATYSGCHWNVCEYSYMKQNCHFQRGVSQYKNGIMPLSSSGIHTTY